MLLFMILTGCAPDDSATAVFDYVWNDFDTLYGGFQVRGVDWDEVHDAYAPLVTDATSEDELYEVFGEMLATLDDGHVRMAAPDREILNANRVYREHLMKGTFDIELVKDEYIVGDIDTGPWDWYVYGVVGDGIPYLWLPGIDDNTWVIETIADEHPDAAGFVVDLRHSHGGAFTFPFEKGLGRLTAEDRVAFRSRSKNGPEHDAFDDWLTWELEARSPHWDVPLVVLTDAETVSATERVLEVLQDLPRTTTIGVRTNGALATSILREAPNGWTYQLSVQEVEAADGAVHEGIGCPVDLELLNDPADVEAGRDEVLETAIALIEAGDL